MKKKKYGWPRRCLSLVCVMVLISMIVLQSIPVTYASGSDDSEWLNTEPLNTQQDAFTSEPEDNSQMISTSEMEPEQEIQTDSEQQSESFSDGITSDRETEIPSGNGEQQNTDVSKTPSGESETDNTITDGEKNETVSGKNADSEQPETPVSDTANPEEENEDIWKNSIASAELSGDFSKDIVAIARTQLGVQENKDNYMTTPEGVTAYYSRYGQWAGNAYEEWSTAFVSFCANYAGISQQYLPKGEKTADWVQQLETMSLHISKEGYVPKEGDLIFFQTNEHADGNSQIQTEIPGHTGIVTGADEQTVYTIEGNCGGMVQEETYATDSDNIYGYLSMDLVKKAAGLLTDVDDSQPTGDAEVTPEEPQPTEIPEVTPEEPQPTELPEISPTEVPDNEDAESSPLEWKNDNVTITAEELTEEALSEGTTLNVIPVEKDNNETAFQYAEVESQLQKKAENEDYEIAGFLAYDIQLINADGESYEPEGKVKISIQYHEPTIPELKEGDVEESDSEVNVTVMHLEEDDSGNVTEVVDLSADDSGENLIRNIETEENQAVTNVEFAADSFSTYAITWTSSWDYIKDVQKNQLTEEQYKEYLKTMLAEVEGTDNGNLPVKNWRRSSGYVNADVELTTSETTDSSTNKNWWTKVSGLNLGKTEASEVWDGSRNETHDFTNYLPNKMLTVYKEKLYDSATWADHHSGENNGSVYRFQGTFDIGTDDPNNYTYTIQQVTGNNKLYINDDMWVFIYPQGVPINSSNYMDYLAFWTGTRNQNKAVKYFNDRLGTVATKDGEASELTDLTRLTDGWNMVSVTDNAGAIIQSVYNMGNHETTYVIDVFTEDYNTGGGTYRLTVNKQRQPKTTVKLKKTDAGGLNPLAGAVFAVDDSSNSVHYTAVSDNDGMLTFSLLNNNTYTLSELRAPNGYKKSTDKWTIAIDGEGKYTIKKQGSDQEIERLDDEEHTYYITNTSSITVVTEKELAHEKYIKYNPEDGNYDLTLNVTGAVGTAATQYKLDVLFVMDTSNSMKDSMSNDQECENYTTNTDSRFYNQQKAIENAILILNQKTNVDARYAIVDFDTTAGVRTEWTNGAVTYPAKVANYGSGSGKKSGGTNYQAALIQAQDLLGRARGDATTIVIFLSDGDPTFYNASTGNSVEGNGTNYEEEAMTKACGVLQEMSMNYFYMVGVGPSSKYSKLNTMKTYVPTGTTTHDAYNGTSATALKEAFDDIIDEATNLLCTGVRITDTLSEYAKIVNGNPADILKVSVKDVTGKEITELNYNHNPKTPVKDVITPSLQPESNPTRIILDFADDYQLESGYTYYVTVKIEPTDASYEYYKTHNFQYPNVGAEYTDENPAADKKPGSDTVNTGTSSKQPGFFSNAEAKVSYIYNGKSKSEDYKNPVLQIDETRIQTEVSFTKIWKDGNNFNETRPDSIGLTLQYRVKNNTDSNANAGNNADANSNADINSNDWQIYHAENMKNPFTLEKNKQDEENPDLWKTTITGLPTWIDNQEVEYRIIEDTVNGYETEQTDFTTITNKAKWKIIKQDSTADKDGNHQRLSGAEFTLSQQGNSSDASGTEGSSEREIATAVSGSGDSLGILEWAPVQNKDSSDTDNSDTSADVMENLNGSYILRETKAPAGYVRSTEEWTLEFKDGILTRVNGNKVGKDNRNEITCFLSNRKTGELPDTGSTGTFGFTISGAAVLIAGTLLLYINKRKEEKAVK